MMETIMALNGDNIFRDGARSNGDDNGDRVIRRRARRRGRFTPRPNRRKAASRSKRFR